MQWKKDRFFTKLKQIIVNLGLGYRGVFWLTGFLAFFISPVADNLTTALVMCAITLAIGKDNPKFIILSSVNIVVAANAGGAFSPFGDITTLMVWQSGHVSFNHFFVLFFPSLINFLVPAIIFNFFIPRADIINANENIVALKKGALVITSLFLLTVITAIVFANYLMLPPALGMMTGLGYLMLAGYWLENIERNKTYKFDIFHKIQNAEWDTLLFFYGVLICVQGIAAIGYLELLSTWIYHDTPPVLPGLFDQHTQANALIGIFSAIVDNIPVMYAVLTMNHAMSEGQWLLVTLTAGVGGSLLSIGSAAGIAVMGKTQGMYGFMDHLKWSWAIFLGYLMGIFVHLWLNSNYF